uniref:Uncharacterized protein n=1 Tax=Schistosoma curassoni TaxID=6186 RepID=A0A183JHT2_9TREM
MKQTGSMFIMLLVKNIIFRHFHGSPPGLHRLIVKSSQDLFILNHGVS